MCVCVCVCNIIGMKEKEYCELYRNYKKNELLEITHV